MKQLWISSTYTKTNKEGYKNYRPHYNIYSRGGIPDVYTKELTKINFWNFPKFPIALP